MVLYHLNPKDEDEYIDLILTLEDLYVDVQKVLASIRKVRIQYD